jgi:very-short-patch-repair endonuclease
LGYSDRAIEHRLAICRLHRFFRGIYIVGRPEVSTYGRWFGAVLACGEGAVLSHISAARLWGIVPREAPLIHVSVTRGERRQQGIVVHRRSNLARRDLRRRYRIPVTAPATTIVDIAAGQPEHRLERAINDADQLGVIRFDVLVRELARMPRRRGLGSVNALILRHTFRLTRSELERLFLPIARRAALPTPETRATVNGFEVDFWFPGLGIVVEADSLTYHRTPGKQLQDRLRDQAHFAAGLIPLRFTHWQIARQASYVEERLRAVAPREGQAA